MDNLKELLISYEIELVINKQLYIEGIISEDIYSSVASDILLAIKGISYS